MAAEEMYWFSCYTSLRCRPKLNIFYIRLDSVRPSLNITCSGVSRSEGPWELVKSKIKGREELYLDGQKRSLLKLNCKNSETSCQLRIYYLPMDFCLTNDHSVGVELA